MQTRRSAPEPSGSKKDDNDDSSHEETPIVCDMSYVKDEFSCPSNGETAESDYILPDKNVIVTSRKRKRRKKSNADDNKLTDAPLTEKKYKECHDIIVNKLDTIIKLLQELKDSQSEIMQNKKLPSYIDDSDSDEGFSLPNFPIRNIEVFFQFEEALKMNRKLESKFIRKFLTIQGATSGKTIRNVLKFLMTDELCAHFSWSGQRKTKIRFQDYTICKIILFHMRMATKETDYFVTRCVKMWLQHAVERKNRTSTDPIMVVKENIDKPNDDKPNDDKPNDDKPYGDKPNDDKPNDDKPIDAKPNDDSPISTATS